MVRLLTIIHFVLFAPTLFGASWYFDNAATAGSNNGTSWANAWTNNASVDWTGSGVLAGDTLHVSGGSSTKTYTENLVISKDGTHNNYIRIRIGQDAGHNGVAHFTNATITPSTSRPKWVWIDGGRDPAFVAPTNHQQVVNGSTAITNNIGFVIRDILGTNNSDTSPAAFFFRNPDSVKLSWIKVQGLTNTGNFAFHELRGTVCYIDMGDEGSDPGTNNVFEYMCLERNMGQQFAKVSGVPTGYDDFVFKFGWINLGGEDHFEVGGGFTIRDSVIGPCYPNGVHNDFFQFTGQYFKVYNNDIRESQNAIMRIQTSPGGVNTTLTHSVWFYNNLVTEKQGRALGGGTLVEPFCVVHFDSANPTHMTILSNIVIANNTIYNSVISTVVDPDEMCRNPVMYWLRGNQVTNAIVISNLFVNNLVVDKHLGIAFPVSTNVQPTGTYWPHTTNDLLVDFNVFAGTNTSLITDPRRISYMDTSANAESHPQKFSNVTNYPVWVDAANDNFELSLADVYSRNTGKNLASYFTKDALNRPRNIAGAWDRGALEAQNEGLIVFLSFDNDAAGENATDDSGNGFTGKRFNLSEYSYPSNRLASAAAAPTFRPNISGNAADFLWRTNNGVYNPTYLDDGAFFAITNAFNALSNMSEMTVMCWARYQNNNRTDVASPSYDKEANAQLICGGGTANGTAGSWFLGRYNLSININETRFVVHTNPGAFTGTWGSEGDRAFGRSGQVIFNYLDRGFEQNGNTTNWYHYAATFSNGIVKTYYNAVAIGTNDMSANVTKLRLGGSGQRAYDWVGIGVNTHVGTPEFDNESGTDYPNNGWFNGALDQVRIYNRTLSWQEIVNVANSEGAQFPDAPLAPTSSSVPVSVGRGKHRGGVNKIHK